VTDEQDVHLDRAEAEAAEDARADAQALVDNDESPDAEGGDPLTAADYQVAFSPRNVAIGLAIVAGVVAFALSRRRGRSSSRDRAND
jgi:hypothetical protein